MKIKTIGVVGGVGPYAGLDLTKKIMDASNAHYDQEHNNILLFSYPASIPDRTMYLEGKEQVNPGEVIGDIILRLEMAGADVIGIPCNTSHAPEIYTEIENILRNHRSKVKLVNMVESVARYIATELSGNITVGILATNGTANARVYDAWINSYNLKVVYPEKAMQERVHEAIYDKEYGIKSNVNPVSKTSVDIIHAGIQHLVNKGANIIVLACTELPLAVPEGVYYGCKIIDATKILAHELVREINK